MLHKQTPTNNGDEPPLIRKISKKLIVVNIMTLFFWPLLAQEAEPTVEAYPWDYGTIKAPVMVQTEISEKEPEEAPPELKPVNGHGNGTCVPYARERTGIELYGWAGTFLEQASSSGYTVTEVPMEGCMVVTSESGGHVAVVEEITADGIRVSEQNYKGLYVVSERIIPFEDPIILGYIR